MAAALPEPEAPCYKEGKLRAARPGAMGCYSGSLAEYYSISWRKGEAEDVERAARKQWRESMEMVW